MASSDATAPNAGVSLNSSVTRPVDTAPLWHSERSDILPEPVTLRDDIACDFVIVGAGITGLAIAQLLSKTHSVAVLDSQEIGAGASGWNAGILSDATTIDLQIVERLIGEDGVRMLLTALTNRIGSIKQELGLADEHWQSGSSVYLADKSRHNQVLSKERAIRARYGLETLPAADELKESWRQFTGAIAFGGEHAVHPVKLLHALAAAVLKQGGRIFERTTVHSWSHDGEAFLLDCGQAQVKAKNLVLCAGLKGSDLAGVAALSGRMIPVTGYILVTEPSQEAMRLVREHDVIAMWDSAQLYHYVRYLPDGRILVGGEEAPGMVPGSALATTDARIQRLYAWAQQHHAFALPPIQNCWRASLAVPAAGLPLVDVQRRGNGLLITAITDGLPSGLVLGSAIASACIAHASGGNNSAEDAGARLLELLSRRRLSTSERLLCLLPRWPWLRLIASKAAFAWLQLLDRLP